jgi:hypothetical protein
MKRMIWLVLFITLFFSTVTIADTLSIAKIEPSGATLYDLHHKPMKKNCWVASKKQFDVIIKLFVEKVMNFDNRYAEYSACTVEENNFLTLLVNWRNDRRAHLVNVSEGIKEDVDLYENLEWLVQFSENKDLYSFHLGIVERFVPDHPWHKNSKKFPLICDAEKSIELAKTAYTKPSPANDSTAFPKEAIKKSSTAATPKIQVEKAGNPWGL